MEVFFKDPESVRKVMERCLAQKSTGSPITADDLKLDLQIKERAR